MTEKSGADALMGYSFLAVFGNDDTISGGELKMLKRLALEDGEIDDDERGILRAVFDRANPDHMDDATKAEIARFREKYGI
jgi:hypothetical protein